MSLREIDHEIQAIAILCITVVLLALIAWGCDVTRSRELTNRTVSTNTVLNGGQ